MWITRDALVAKRNREKGCDYGTPRSPCGRTEGRRGEDRSTDRRYPRRGSARLSPPTIGAPSAVPLSDDIERVVHRIPRVARPLGDGAIIVTERFTERFTDGEHGRGDCVEGAGVKGTESAGAPFRNRAGAGPPRRRSDGGGRRPGHAGPRSSARRGARWCDLGHRSRARSPRARSR